MQIHLFTDLDRTLLPNGSQEESPKGRAIIRQGVEDALVDLTFVTGRHLELVLDAMESYQLPSPSHVICNVGTTIYRQTNGHWRSLEAWTEKLLSRWKGYHAGQLHLLLADLSALRLQEAERQTNLKLSYTLYPADVSDSLFEEIQNRLRSEQIDATLIFSIDETTGQGLLDILPPEANKLAAIEFLIEERALDLESCLFSGDSGNDLEPLCSHLKTIVVANATQDVKDHVIQSQAHGVNPSRIYIATGSLNELNGNYAAGIVEGIYHYFPQLRPWLEKQLK